VNRVVAGLFVFAAVANLLPVLGALGAERLEGAYGVAIADPNLEVLMRHRALLFGVVGGLLLAAAWRPALRGLAGAAGLFSMLSFIAVVWIVGEANDELRTVAIVDAVAALALAAGLLLDRRARGD